MWFIDIIVSTLILTFPLKTCYFVFFFLLPPWIFILNCLVFFVETVKQLHLHLNETYLLASPDVQPLVSKTDI